MRKQLNIFVPVATVLMIFGFILFADEVIPSTTAAVSLCITSIIPSLLPFFVCSRLLLGFGVCEFIGQLFEKLFVKVFRLPPVFSSGFLLGSVCGYPMGAKISASFFASGYCTKRQASFAAILCNNAGPLFIIGTLGTTLLHHTCIGRQLWFIHLCAAIITILFLRNFIPNTSSSSVRVHKNKNRMLDLFSEAVSDSVKTIFQICGLIIFFNAIIKTLVCFGLPESGLLIGLIEMTTGLSYLVTEKAASILPLCSFLLSFGGVSVFMQVAAEFLPHHIPLWPYIIGKTIQGGIAAALTSIYYHFFPISTQVVSMTIDASTFDTQPILLASSVIILALFLLVNCKRISRDSP